MSGGPDPAPRAAASSSLMSAPATNVRPAHRITMPVAASSAIANRSAVESSSATRVLSALTGGLSISTTAMPAEVVVRTYPDMVRTYRDYLPWTTICREITTVQRSPAFHDIAHLGHVELLTPRPAESLAFFTSIVGLHEVATRGDSVYLRAWGEYQLYSLKLTGAKTSGLGHVAFRASSAEALDRIVSDLRAHAADGAWIEDEIGHGPAYRVQSPDGHAVEVYYETARFAADASSAPGFKNQPARYEPRGIAPRRLDHVNILASDVRPTREFFQHRLGLRLTEQIIFDDGTEVGSWLSATNKSYDLAITKDRSGARGRFHHLTYFVDS